MLGGHGGPRKGATMSQHDRPERPLSHGTASPAASRVGLGALRAPSLGFDLQPGLPQGFGEVVIHRVGDGHRPGDGLRLLVVLAQAAAEVLLDHRVTDGVDWREGGTEGDHGQNTR